MVFLVQVEFPESGGGEEGKEHCDTEHCGVSLLLKLLTSLTKMKHCYPIE
jgi:hypothetical protein